MMKPFVLGNEMKFLSGYIACAALRHKTAYEDFGAMAISLRG